VTRIGLLHISPSCRASHSTTGLYIPLQSSSQSLHTTVLSDNHVMTFVSDKHYGLVNIGDRR
jgi:hypothetical protein